MQPGSMPSAVTLAGAILFSVAALPTAAVNAEPITLRLHTHVPPASGSYKNLQWWARKIEKDSGGRLLIKIFGSNQLGGKAEDIYDQVRNGAVDIGWTLPGYKGGLFPTTSVFELPFIGAEASTTSQAIDDYARKWGKAEWSAVRPIVFHSAGVSVLHMKTRPIEKLADFKGLKIRTPSRIATAALAALGATPVLIPGLMSTEALLRDVVDGVVTPWSIAYAIRTVDAARFHTENHLHEPTLAMIMNKKSYAKLPADLKQVIDANSGRWLAKTFGEKWTNDDQRGRGRAEALRHPVTVIGAAEAARWRKATRPVYENWIKEMDNRGLPGGQMVEDAEALIAKYKAAAQTN